MDLVIWTAIGTCVEMFARKAMPGPDRMGTIGSLVLGVGSAVAGGVIGMAIGNVGLADYDVRSMLTATIASLAVMFLARAYAIRGFE